jgi:predicted dehydrogenase
MAASATVSAFGAFGIHAQEDATPTNSPAPTGLKRRIKVGVVGLGGRGHWIAGLFRQHGGYQLQAVADYFPEVADQKGEVLGVPKSRRFSGLGGYQKVIESGIEALVVEDVPFFYPQQAQAAVAAGLHVYMAKPVAVDVPGALSISESAKRATAKQRVFLVDYQMPTDPVNLEIVQRIRAGVLGKLAHVQTVGIQVSSVSDPPPEATIENRLRRHQWVSVTALGCGFIGNYDIHAVDAALWAIGQRPVSAMGASRICRPDPHSDSHDATSVTFEYADGLVHSHFGQSFRTQSNDELSCRVYGLQGNALINYWGKSLLKAYDDHYEGDVADLYAAGAKRNIAAFYKQITEGDCANLTLPRSVDGVLTCVLGREAAARHGKLTMDELLKENKKLEVDLTGLKA